VENLRDAATFEQVIGIKPGLLYNGALPASKVKIGFTIKAASGTLIIIKIFFLLYSHPSMIKIKKPHKNVVPLSLQSSSDKPMEINTFLRLQGKCNGRKWQSQ
jgi:hypothetical protein